MVLLMTELLQQCYRNSNFLLPFESANTLTKNKQHKNRLRRKLSQTFRSFFLIFPKFSYSIGPGVMCFCEEKDIMKRIKKTPSLCQRL